MRVADPRHPLYGRRFRVVRRTTRPGRSARIVEVWLRDEVVIRLNEADVEAQPSCELRTRLTSDSVRELVDTARTIAAELSTPSVCHPKPGEVSEK